MLIVGSVTALGLGFKPFYLAGRKPGHFHVLGGPATARRRLARRLTRFYRGFPGDDPDLYDNMARGADRRVRAARPTTR